MSKFLVTKKHYGDSNAKFIVGKYVLEIDDINTKRFSIIKKHFETKFQLSFNTNGGNTLISKEVILGKPYGELPIPTKSQHIFLGWFTNASGGTQITSETLVSLDINTLYAQWEEVQIASDCTSYSVTTTSSYKNTGIYTASIVDTSQPIYIDWGDGTVEKLTSSISQKSHTYKTVGNFTVKISNNISSFAPSSNNSAWYGTTSQNRYTFKCMLTTGSKVTSLPTYAFYYCSVMTNIDFMQTCWPTVTAIPNYCFYYCSGLSSIQGAKRFASLGSYCFRYCSGLTGIQDLSEFKFTTLPNSYIFANCTNVTQWILPSGFTGTSFGSYMFYNNIKLSALALPNSLTSIGSYAYQGCSNLKSLNIPENLQIIGDYAFAGCYQISSIVDKRLTAQTISINTFGNTTGTGINAYIGYQTKGNNILSTYFAATGYDENTWNDPLQNPDKCGFVQQYIDPENVIYYTVTFDAGNGSIVETSKQIAKNRKIGELPEPICPEDMPYFGGWYAAANGEGDRITKDYRVTSDITLYALYSNTPFTSYEVILNNQWQASTIANPDSSLYDGIYESFSNYNVGSKAAVMYIKITGYTSFTIYIRSNAESSYDYTVAFNFDTYTPSNPLTSNPSSSTSGVKAHTSGKQNSGTTIGSYTKVEYTGIDGGEHYICVAYRKDGSVNNGTDRGYVLIDKQM